MDAGGEAGGGELPLVLLDANALMLPFQTDIDLDSEIERKLGRCTVAVPEVVVEELARLALKDVNARAALKLAERYEVARSGRDGDDAIFRLAVERRAVVVTADRELIARLEAAGLHVLRPRQLRQLTLR